MESQSEEALATSITGSAEKPIITTTKIRTLGSPFAG